jgi:hypothetical protein
MNLRASRRGLARPALAMLALVAVCAAHADDWRMFRKDAARTAASTDKIGLPLKQVWSWKSQRLRGVAALSTAVTQGKYIYFTSGPQIGADTKNILNRLLVCAVAETGQPVWQRQLGSPRLSNYSPEDIGPAVTEQGIVYVTDAVSILNPCPMPTYAISAFSAKGDLIDKIVIPLKNNLSRFFLRDGDGKPNYLLTPDGKPVG